MTKAEAIAALNAGKKVRHRYFLLDDYIHLMDGVITSEDGVKHNSFWELHQDTVWDSDWQVISDAIEIEVKGKKGIEINSRNAGISYTIEEIELGTGPHKKAVKYVEGLMQNGAQCKAIVITAGKVRIVL